MRGLPDELCIMHMFTGTVHRRSWLSSIDASGDGMACCLPPNPDLLCPHLHCPRESSQLKFVSPLTHPLLCPSLQPQPYSAGGRTFAFDDPCDYFTYGKAKASTLSLSVLVAIEMFNALNALSEVSGDPQVSCQVCSQILQGFVSLREPTLTACNLTKSLFSLALLLRLTAVSAGWLPAVHAALVQSLASSGLRGLLRPPLPDTLCAIPCRRKLISSLATLVRSAAAASHQHTAAACRSSALCRSL